MTTTIINVKAAPKDWKRDDSYVYIGRSPQYGPDRWGNPYVIGADGATRDEVLSLYLAWVQRQVKHNSSFLHRVYGLHDKTLVCHCAPAPCHGDFLVHLADGLARYEHERGREDFCEITIVGDQNRLTHAQGIVTSMVMKHGQRIRREMRLEAERAAKAELGKTSADPLAKWKLFRKRYLTPLLHWEMPLYREPLGGLS